MTVVILGLGVSGKAAARFFKKKNRSFICVDSAESNFEGSAVLSDVLPPQLDGVALLVKSPGISHSHPWVIAARENNIPIVGEIDLALNELKGKNKKVFGITGSNGKTTTTLLTAHLFQVGGIKAVAAGNVGIPLLDVIEQQAEVFVVELSSFQLEKIIENQVLDGALILNVTPNHLDRHASFEEYVQAKCGIARCLKKDAPLYVSRQAAESCQRFLQKHTIFDLEKEKVETIWPLGYRDNLYPHDVENVTAAYALARPTVEVFQKGIETFVRPPHRLELVGVQSGVTYINDSKATSVDAVIKGVLAIKGPIQLIAGGVDKGGSFAEWIPYFRSKVLRVWAMGKAAHRIKQELSPEIAVQEIASLEEGVDRATQMAEAGSTILLSPGCSSYDQFKDYQHRGECFKQIVKRIAKELL